MALCRKDVSEDVNLSQDNAANPNADKGKRISVDRLEALLGSANSSIHKENSSAAPMDDAEMTLERIKQLAEAKERLLTGAHSCLLMLAEAKPVQC
jgi:hypothetical protein